MVDKQIKSIDYSFVIGIQKSLKNMFVVFILPAVMYLISNYTQWMTQEQAVAYAPIMGFLGYLIKNFAEIKFLGKV